MPIQTFVLTLGFLTIVTLGLLFQQSMLARQAKETVTLLRELLTTEKERTSQLTNLLVSRDPMTFATLQANSTISSMASMASEYHSIGTDEAEFLAYKALKGEALEDDYSDDLSLAGFGDDLGGTG